DLMGDDVCFEEVSLRYIPKYDGKPYVAWHRDCTHHESHPLRMEYLQLMVYLTDVDETTHCFSLSPEAADAPILKTEEQLARGGIVDLHAPAGTAILFNSAVLHTATVRATERDRKTIQT